MNDDADQPTFEGPLVPEPGFEPPLPAADVQRCPSCLSPIRADQRYCLECGERLGIDEIPPPPGGGSAMAERGAGLLAVTAVVLVLIGAGLSWVALREPTDGGSTSATETTATGGLTTDATITDTIVTEETITEDVITEETITEDVFTDETVPVPGEDDWPPGETGWAVILASKDIATFSREDAQVIADEATAAGVVGVGVLDSTNYPTLNPGYWAVYSGPFTTKADAETEAGEIRLLGYPEAYVREVAP